MRPTDVLAAPPAPDRTLDVLERIAEVLELPVVWVWRRGYHFSLGDGWTIALTPQSADRFRVDLYHYLASRASLYALATDEERLAAVVLDLAREVGVREGV